MNDAVPLPRRVWAVLILVFAFGFVHFWISGTPVRLATTDDVAFQAVATNGNAAAYLADNARDQGRFLYCTPIYRYALFSLYQVGNPWAFSLLRTVGFFAQVVLAAGLAARVMQSAAFGAAVALFLTGLLHLPSTFFLVLSFPPAWIGFAALLGALHCHLTHLRQPGFLPGLMTGLLYLLAVLMHDVFIIFLPLFLALAVLQEKAGWRQLVRRNIAPLTVAVAYVAVHRGFAAEFPSVYEGTKFSPDMVVAAKVIVRQMIGIVPGFELVVNRVPAETTGPLFRSLSAVRATLGALTWSDGLLGLGTALALTYTIAHCLRTRLPRTRLWLWALGFAGLANLPIAFSAKYQVFILHREFPYGYACFSFYFLGVAAIGALVSLGQRIPEGRGRLLLIAALSAGAILLGLSALASNHRVLQILRERYN